jgi:hypothetical protein
MDISVLSGRPLSFHPWRLGGSSTQAWMPAYVSILRIPQMIWVWRATVEWYIDRENRRKTCPSATLSTTNTTWIDPGANLGLRGERPATNGLSHGTATLIPLTTTETVTSVAIQGRTNRHLFANLETSIAPQREGIWPMLYNFLTRNYLRNPPSQYMADRLWNTFTYSDIKKPFSKGRGDVLKRMEKRFLKKSIFYRPTKDAGIKELVGNSHEWRRVEQTSEGD